MRVLLSLTISIAFLNVVSIKTVYANDGISTQIDAKKLADVQAWVNNSKHDLENGIQTISKLELPVQEAKLRDLINDVLKKSDLKTNESAMRNVLARVVVVHDILLQTPASPKRDAFAHRILKDGITWALEMYEPDATALKKQSTAKVFKNIDFNDIGLDWIQYSLSAFYQMPTNASREQFILASLGIAYNDMAQDDHLKDALAPEMKFIIEQTEKQKALSTSDLEKSRALRQVLEDVYKESQEILKTLATRTSSQFIFNQLSFNDQKDLPFYDKPTYYHKEGPGCFDFFCYGDEVYEFQKHMIVTGPFVKGNTQYKIMRIFDHSDDLAFFACEDMKTHREDTCTARFMEVTRGFYKHVTVGDDIIIARQPKELSNDTRWYTAVKVISMRVRTGEFTVLNNGTPGLFYGGIEEAYVRHGCYQGVCVGMRVGNFFVVGLDPMSKKPVLIAESDTFNSSETIFEGFAGIKTPKVIQLMTLEDAKKLIF